MTEKKRDRRRQTRKKDRATERQSDRKVQRTRPSHDHWLAVIDSLALVAHYQLRNNHPRKISEVVHQQR